MNLSLERFVKALETHLRMHLEHSCDILILGRLKCFQMLLTDTTATNLAENIANSFTVRLDHILSVLSDNFSNQAYILMNSVFFAEDLWCALGYLTGVLTVARSDLIAEDAAFKVRWRDSIEVSFSH